MSKHSYWAGKKIEISTYIECVYKKYRKNKNVIALKFNINIYYNTTGTIR